MKKFLLVSAACAMLSGSANAAMYLIGAPADPNWSPAVGIEMEEVDGGWKWSGFVGETDYFAFATQLADPDNINWDDFNANYRISPDDGDGTEAATGVYAMHLGAPAGAFHGAGTEVTYFVQETDGAYTLSVTEKDSTPLYLIGQAGGGEWSPMKGIKMKNVDGGWEWSGFVGEADYFAFATQLMDEEDWATFNANYRLSPAEEYTEPEAVPGEYALRFGTPEGAFHGNDSNVKYFVKEVNGEYTLTVTDVKVENPWPDDAIWGVVGSFNGWGENPDFKMTEIRPGVWKATMYDFSGSFKFRANENWDYNFGSASQNSGEATLIEADGVYEIAWNGVDFNIPEEVEEVIFELDLNTSTLTIDGLTPTFLALRGNFIDWQFEWSYLFNEVESGVYMLYLDGVGEDWRFKISDQDWNEFYTTGVTDMVAGEIYPLIDRDGPDMGVDRTYSEVTMFLNVDEEYFSFYGEVANSVARAEIESGNARYFNMQGVEVKNPSDGIFIRLVNGKSEKITLK
ncbi:MAG: hypothetical protein K2L22_03755 [Muribaculaceae bacterium]|nr:hypothetical protein [Muribaculaceae bacterium]